jgi:hypothetical protein
LPGKCLDQSPRRERLVLDYHDPQFDRHQGSTVAVPFGPWAESFDEPAFAIG